MHLNALYKIKVEFLFFSKQEVIPFKARKEGVKSIRQICLLHLPNPFNSVISRFERADFLEKISMLRESPTPQNNPVVSREWVTAPLKKVKKRKVAGPDGICGCIKHFFAELLSEIFFLF